MRNFHRRLRGILSRRRVPSVREAEGKRLAEIGRVERLDAGSCIVSIPKSDRRFMVVLDEGGPACECTEHVKRGTRCLHICAAEALFGMERRAERARLIVEKGQVRRVDDYFYRVESQTEAGEHYEVRDYGAGWACNCPDHMVTGHRCKHIRAVELSAGIRQRVAEDVVIGEVSPRVCRGCGSDRVIGDGWRKATHRLKCKACGKRFSDNLGFEKRHFLPKQITKAMDSYFSGASFRKTADALSMLGCGASRSTVWRWVNEYSNMLNEYAEDLTPNPGEDWRTDEIYLKMRTDKQWLYTMIDADTRYWLASMIGPEKEEDDTVPLLMQAEDVGGKKPRTFASDGAGNFARDWYIFYRPKDFLEKNTRHVRHIHQDGDYNNNQMEAFNGATLRHRLKVTRGLGSPASPVVPGLMIYHNFIRSHQGIGMYGDTPAERAGIRVQGEDKWKTLIQNAKKKADGAGKSGGEREE